MGSKGEKINDSNILLWKYEYGYVSISFFKKSKVISKQVVFYNLPKYEIDEKILTNIKGTTHFKEVIKRLGKTIETGQYFEKDHDVIITSYTWKTEKTFSDYSFSSWKDKGHLLIIGFSKGTVCNINKY